MGWWCWQWESSYLSSSTAGHISSFHHFCAPFLPLPLLILHQMTTPSFSTFSLLFFVCSLVFCNIVLFRRCPGVHCQAKYICILIFWKLLPISYIYIYICIFWTWYFAFERWNLVRRGDESHLTVRGKYLIANSLSFIVTHL